MSMNFRDREGRDNRDRDNRDKDKDGFQKKVKKKACRFCTDRDIYIDYKEPKLVGSFVTDRGKLIPRRVTGNCAYHQRRITEAVKRARILALLPYTTVYSVLL